MLIEKDDPLNEASAEVVPGLIHRYPHKALWLSTYHCAATCDFCFRQARRQTKHPGALVQLPAIKNYLSIHHEVEEVIFSGGDPLTLATATTKNIIKHLSELKNLASFRWHTRLPVVAPERVESGYAAIWKELINHGKTVKIVLHLNHPQEISPSLTQLVKKWRQLGVEVLAQGVLLKNINDNSDTLAKLWRAQTAAHITPYYLHQLDRAPSTGHFHVTPSTGLKIYQKACAKFSGTSKESAPSIPFAPPRYIIDLGSLGKIDVAAYLNSLSCSPSSSLLPSYKVQPQSPSQLAEAIGSV